MVSFFSSLLSWFAGLFFSKTAEITIVGLQASGKTSFVNVIGSGQWSEDVVPTVAFHFRKIRKGNVTLKVWDLAGQPRYRSIWERYCNGVDAVVFVVDSSDKEKFETASFELHQLLTQPTLTGVPLLVLGNKNDLEGHAPVTELIRALQLDKIQNRPVSCYSVRRYHVSFPQLADPHQIVPQVLHEITTQFVCYSDASRCSCYSRHNRDIVLKWLSERSH